MAARSNAANHPALKRQRLTDQNLVPMLKRLAFDFVEPTPEPANSSAPALPDVNPPPDTVPKAKKPKAEAPVAEPKPKLTLAQRLANLDANPSVQLN